MNWRMPHIAFDPLLPEPLLAILAVLALLVALWGIARRARGAWLRLLPLAVLVIAALNPRLAAEQREALDDVVVVVVDESASQRIGNRQQQSAEALEAVQQRLGRLDGLDVRIEHLPPSAGDQGTLLFEALDRAVSDVPRRRLAGSILITDGQVHDIPQQPGGAPVHVLLTGERDEGDRRLVIERAPSFGLVGRDVTVTLRVEDPAPQGSALVDISINGTPVQSRPVPLNQSHEITVPIEHAGQTVVELEVEEGPRELSLVNNRTAVAISGVRDRLRVLLVSGEPHAGERTWRNLLKADPSVDLVHFTILRPPEKDDRTPLSELALISFPVRELFEEKLEEFDLVIFDRYRRRGVLPYDYFVNIAEYVRQGGALLMAVGPEYTDPLTLYDTALESVLPGQPSGQTYNQPFRPLVTELGRRHPVTAGLPGADAEEPQWGSWLRQLGVYQNGGMAVLSGVDNQPLLLLDHVGEGRVAQLLSDTIWLWARGFEGGGPQAELLRRLAHWLMKEPELEEERLTAELRGEELHIRRHSLSPHPANVTVTLPDGEERQVPLTENGDGQAEGVLSVDQPGLYHVNDGQRTAIAAAGSINSKEMAELAATEEKLHPVVQATGGGIHWISDGVPDLRRVQPERAAVGRNWIGLRANGDYMVTAIRDTPLLPPALLLLLGFGGLILTWWREGR
ncbi:hypothetical protein [Telmatospirillum sp. J64-1]|uniref:hypothetical protein n=1 Tax=Telmatospirillum sp. J64-1 TaxID=2502183 RepID=UPI00115C66E1|nr:hypothetical protein [Telmatospirillum sp. J64-1]